MSRHEDIGSLRMLWIEYLTIRLSSYLAPLVGEIMLILFTQVGVPQSIAHNLTVPEVVTDLNQPKLAALVAAGPKNYPGGVPLRYGVYEIA